MKKSLVAVTVLLLFYSCGEKKNDSPSLKSAIVVVEDSTTLKSDTRLMDTVQVDSAFAEKIERLSHANEFFDDFIFNFAADEHLQKRRIVFPLSYNEKNTLQKISTDEWKHDSLFLAEKYYTILANSEDELDTLSDTAVVFAHLDWISLEEKTLKRYHFGKVDGHWRLEAINLHDMADDKNNSFIQFYHRFATDTVFQYAHIRKPLEYLTVDPDDDFSTHETKMEINQWIAFKPELPCKTLTNIGYGQEEVRNSTARILQLKGLGNGFVNTLHFQLRKGEWRLCRFEDVNN